MMSAQFIETKALLQIGPYKLFPRQIVHQIPDGYSQIFTVPTPDPNYRGALTNGRMRFLVVSYPQETHYQILREDTHIVLAGREGMRAEHLIFNGDQDFVVKHISSNFTKKIP